MLTAPPPLTDRDEVLALLRAHHAESPSTRRAPNEIEIASIDALPTLRVSLTSVVEGRGVRVLPIRPAPRPPIGYTPPKIDCWALDGLDLPDDAPIGRRAERALEGEMPCDCERCAGRGERRCDVCRGSGHINSGRHRKTCHACNGRGANPCVTCNGLGGFVGSPMAWSAIVESTAVRIVKGPDLPDDAALAIDAVLEKGGGTLIHRQEGARVEHAVLPAIGYRGSAANPLVEGVDSLLAEIDSAGTARVRTQRLEVRRAAAFRVSSKDGKSFLVWGAPVRVSPEDALDKPSAEIARAFLFGGAILAVAGVLYLLTH
jgi:hypothetical protein